MLNTVYRLVAPRKFQIEYRDIDIKGAQVIIRPSCLSICHADQRYYQGLRETSVLEKKLPMALIHEAIGIVVYDKSGTFKVGERVVMIPNEPPYVDDVIAENYIRNTKFRSSGYDGFLQEYVDTKANRIIAVPDSIGDNVAAFIELMSVAMQAINRFEIIAHKRKDNIAVWGDGNLGYVTSLLLKYMYPESRIIVIGKNEDKLIEFSFVDYTYLMNEIPQGLVIDHAFECVGGNASGVAINQIIDLIEPEGTLSILGVSEYAVSINTRMILEKGIKLVGNSRSCYEDFKQVVELLSKTPDVVEYMEKLVTNIIDVTNLSQIVDAFEVDIKKSYGKTIICWKG